MAQPLIDGDRGFVGVDLRTDPSLLEPGMAAEAKNKVFVKGIAETRKGVYTATWANQVGVTFPITFPAVFDAPTGWRNVYHTIWFRDPNRRNYILIASDKGVYRVSPSGQIRIRTPEAIDETCHMVQVFDVVLLFRGTLKTPWKWDGDPENDFEPISEIDNSDAKYDPSGTLPIPNSNRAIEYQNRLWVPREDELHVSDIFDYSRYDPIYGQFYIGEGTADDIVAISPFGDRSMVIFKGSSIHLLSNLYGDYAQNARLDEITRERGCASPDSLVNTGEDLWFLSYDGVYTIRQVLENKLTGSSQPVSEAIQPYIDRINWSVKDRFKATYHDNKYFLSVALDGSSRCDTLLVYDFLNQRWAGYWTSGFFDIAHLVRYPVSGKTRLFAINATGVSGKEGALMMLDEGFTDEVLGDEAQISDLLQTRGYTYSEAGHKRFKRAEVQISTWNPTFSVSAIRDGVNESDTLVTNETKDRTKYYLANKDDYDPTNTNDDHGQPYREDYSVPLTGNLFLGDNGINFDAHQTATEPYVLRGSGEYLQLRITNTQGRCAVRKTSLRAMSIEQQVRRKA